jgi:hypothetical protein
MCHSSPHASVVGAQRCNLSLESPPLLDVIYQSDNIPLGWTVVRSLQRDYYPDPVLKHNGNQTHPLPKDPCGLAVATLHPCGNRSHCLQNCAALDDQNLIRTTLILSLFGEKIVFSHLYNFLDAPWKLEPECQPNLAVSMMHGPVIRLERGVLMAKGGNWWNSHSRRHQIFLVELWIPRDAVHPLHVPDV